MATTITYGWQDARVTFKDVHIEEISQEPEIDNGDPIYTKIRVVATSVMWTSNVGAGTVAIGTKVTPDGSDTIAGTQYQDDGLGILTTPRRPFILDIGGTQMFNVEPIAYASPNRTGDPIENATTSTGALKNKQYDVNNGPVPSFEVMKVIGVDSMRVRMTFEFCIRMCDDVNPYTPVAMRYWMSEELNTQWMTTRRYEGYVRSSNRAIHPHAFRGLVMPPLARGFQRTHISLEESRDNLTLSFRIEDQEKYALPPAPATDWSGTHTVTFPYPGSNYAESEVFVRLHSNRNVSPDFLRATAWAILDDRLHITNRENRGNDFVKSIEFSRSFENNVVEAKCRVMHTDHFNPRSSIYEWGRLVRVPIAGVTESYTQDQPRVPYPSASLAGVFLGVMQNQCGLGKATPYSNAVVDYRQFTHGQTPGAQEVDDEDKTQQQGQDNGNEDAQRPEGYQNGDAPNTTSYSIENEYNSNSGRIAMRYATDIASKLPFTTGKRGTPGSGFRAVGLNDGFVARTMQVLGQRINDWPIMPRNEDFTDENGVVHLITNWVFTPSETQLSADGRSAMYNAGVTATYHLMNEPTSQTKFMVGLPPYIKKSIGRFFVPPEAFQSPGGGGGFLK